MATSTTPAPAARTLRLVSGGRRRPVDRDAALRQVRTARRQLQPRHERFAHLKRIYD
jgi:hypothetical protein